MDRLELNVGGRLGSVKERIICIRSELHVVVSED